MFRDKTILITGGTGSWGNELTNQLINYLPRRIIIYSRGELAQVEMSRLIPNIYTDIRYVIGDVRDYDALNQAMRGVDYVFHLAALKHVPVCEKLPQEAVKTNIHGTTNVINAAIANNVKKVIDVSTDKAVDPLNLYGMTKAVGERLMIQANELSDTSFVCVRGGNVIGSNGSVIPLFKRILETTPEHQTEAHVLKVTDFSMTRFFLTLPEAIKLLFRAAETSIGGETFVMKMPSYYIKDIAQAMIDSQPTSWRLHEGEVRPGEKFDEVLVSRNEARMAYEFDEDYYLILPMLDVNDISRHYKPFSLKPFDIEEYTSKTFVGDIGDARKMLEESGYIK